MPKFDNGPGISYEAITPDDTDIDTFRGVYVGGTGDLYVTDIDGNAVAFVGLVAGIIHPISGVRIGSDTTCTDVVVIR